MIEIELQLVKVERNCLSAKVVGNQIIYQLKNGLVWKDQKIMNGISSIANIYEYEFRLFYYDNCKLYSLENEGLKLLLSATGSNMIRPLQKKNFVVFTKESRRLNSYKIVNENNQELWSISGNIFLEVVNSLAVISEKFNYTTFKVCEVSSGREKWTYRAPKELRIVNGPFIINSRVLVILEDPEEKYSVVALNQDTGEELWEKRVKIRTPQIGSKSLLEFSSNSFGKGSLTVFNTDTKQVDYSQIPFSERTSGILNSRHDDLLFFSYLTNGCGLGVINLMEKKLIMSFPLGLKEGIQLKAPLVTSTVLGLWDSDQNLHLYQWKKKKCS